MRRHRKHRVILLLCAASCVAGSTAIAQFQRAVPPTTEISYYASVVGVIDGDTIDVLDRDSHQHRIRLSGIDAPERRQPFGQRSKEILASLVYGRIVLLNCGKIEIRPENGRRREICMVTDPQRPTESVNLAMVRAGFAWHYVHFDRDQPIAFVGALRSAETEARTARVGLWADSGPTPPWNWRRTQGSVGAASASSK